MILSFCHFSSCSGSLYDPVGVFLEWFFEIAPLSAFSRFCLPLCRVFCSRILSHGSVMWVTSRWGVWMVGGLVTLCVCLFGGGGSLVGRRVQAHGSLREALSSLGWTNFGWWWVGLCGKVVAVIVHLCEECRDVSCKRIVQCLPRSYCTELEHRHC